MNRLVCIVAIATIAASCGSKGAPAPEAAKGGGKGASGGKRGPLAFPVEVETVAARKVEYAIRAVGSVEAFEQVQVTARVAGVIEKIGFAEGDQVKEGQPLVEIEPRRFQIAVEQARATLQRVDAEKRDAQSGLDRRVEANTKSPGLVKIEDIESLRTKVAAMDAQAAETKAQLDLAELNLRDAFVRAPMSGQIESRDVRTGQYVTPGAKVATLLRRDPLLVRFPVAEAESGKLTKDRSLRFSLREGETSYRAVITHIAQAADPSTRMVPVIARVDDPKASELRPGAFAQVVIPIETRENAAVIPETAVRPSERGFIAYVVEGEVAKERVVTLGLRTLDGRVEVQTGLSVGDALIIRGGEALTDGAKVKVSGAPEPKTAGAGPPEKKGAR